MVYLAYLGESKKIKYKKPNKKYFIVRKPVGRMPKGFIHMPQLSPSVNLLKNALRWKKGQFTKNEIAKLNNTNISYNTKNAWWYLYVPRFKRELSTRIDVQKAVRKIKNESSIGINIYLFCYCKELNKCHRLLVGKHLEQKGLNIDFRNRKKIQNKNFTQLNLFS